ncbi:sialidase family protein [Longitalea luteola]|uniref:sialidase family protein n=1 Tax=Longitalea luteola TaxID=2812563 RepID=UPI001F6231C7|nr:sialidase family protein [Longitalea luteola]
MPMFVQGNIPPEQEIVISQQHYHVPVLIKKKDNPVVRIHVHINAAKEKISLTELAFSTAGSTNRSDIKQVRLFYSGADSGRRNLANVDKLTLVGATSSNAEKGVIKGGLSLSPGDHYFWMSVELHDNASLLHRITVNAVSAVLNGKRTSIAGASKTSQRTGMALRQHNQDNVHTYRIPGLATANDGSLLAVYDARRESARDLQGNIDIGVSRSTDGGNTWLPMQIAIDMGQWGGLPEKFNGVSDANILVDKNTGTIFIAGLWMHGVLDSVTGKWIEGLTDTSSYWNHQWRKKGSQPGFDVKQTAQFLIVKSDDNGKTWSKPVNITQQCKQQDWWLFAPAPGQGITLRDGTLVFPTQGRDRSGRSFSNITYSKDGGATWRTSNRASKENTTENMAVELSDGTIMLNMRCSKNKDTGDTNGRVIAITRNLGMDWTEHPTSSGALHEPVCMASIIRHDYVKKGQKRSVLLFANPDSKATRHHMTIKVSYDDGRTWASDKKILLDEWKSRGYSCLTSIDAETIGILYESSQCDLVFQKIKLKELLP